VPILGGNLQVYSHLKPEKYFGFSWHQIGVETLCFHMYFILIQTFSFSGNSLLVEILYSAFVLSP